MFNIQFSENKPLFVTFPSFCGVSTPTMADLASVSMDLGRDPHNSSWKLDLSPIPVHTPLLFTTEGKGGRVFKISISWDSLVLRNRNQLELTQAEGGIYYKDIVSEWRAEGLWGTAGKRVQIYWGPHGSLVSNAVFTEGRCSCISGPQAENYLLSLPDILTEAPATSRKGLLFLLAQLGQESGPGQSAMAMWL